MKITKDEVLYVADLARLDLDEASINKFAGQTNNGKIWIANGFWQMRRRRKMGILWCRR